jgi:3-oxoacyl-[acyl-carrier-protein] synthase-3
VPVCSIIGLGSYLPSRVVANAELVKSFPGITEEYVQQVTGVLQRHWVAEDEKPSDLAYEASLEAIRNAGIDAEEIDAVILATWTPDVATPSTACILQQRLGLRPLPAFDLNAACSGWLYALSMSRAMIASGMARNVLAVGVDVQSQIVDRTDYTTCLLFGDGAGAAVVSAGSEGHELRHTLIGADSSGLQLARREEPGYCVSNGSGDFDPWIRMDGPALFRFAAGAFAGLIRDAAAASGWELDDVRWIVPHQANARILKAAAKRCDFPFDRVYINVDRVGNTSSASIPVAMAEMQDSLNPGDKLILCSVGAGITTGVVTIEW